MNEISLEEKVKLLEDKVEKLEKIEKRRKTLKWIKISLKVLVCVIIVVLVYSGYRYLKKNYLEPMDNIKEKVNGVTNYDYKSLFNGLFD